MITLITGVPGAGKTLYVVSQILKKLDDENKLRMDKGEEPRRVYVDGIPELLIPHEEFDGGEWPEQMEDGSFGVIDEVQRKWRPMGSGKALPDSIALLETHRHRGIDLVIMTQHPMLMHVNVRNLVGKHIHLRRTAFGIYAYEWSECVNPSSSWKTAVTRVRWTHPKWAFGLYKSAEVHNKVKFRIPFPAIVLGCSLLAVGLLGWRFYSRMQSVIFPEAQAQVQPQPEAQLQPKPVPNPNKISNSSGSRSLEDKREERRQRMLDDPIAASRPRFVGMPETAPMYDEIRQVSVMPVLSGCIADDTNCACFTQQGTSILMTVQECRRNLNVLNRRFNPYVSEKSS